MKKAKAPEINGIEDVAAMEDPRWFMKDSEDRPFYTYLHTREDVQAWKTFFERIRFDCAHCRNRKKIMGMEWVCEAWNTTCTETMKKRENCPYWSFDHDVDIPF